MSVQIPFGTICVHIISATCPTDSVQICDIWIVYHHWRDVFFTLSSVSILDTPKIRVVEYRIDGTMRILSYLVFSPHYSPSHNILPCAQALVCKKTRARQECKEANHQHHRDTIREGYCTHNGVRRHTRPPLINEKSLLRISPSAALWISQLPLTEVNSYDTHE